MSNLLTSINNPLAGVWSFGAGTGSVDVGAAVAPDGTTTAFRLTDLDATAVYTVGQQPSIPADSSPYTFDIWVKKTGVVTNYPVVELRYGATQKFSGIVVNTQLGSLTNRTGWNPDNSAIDGSLDANYWWVWLTLTNGGYTNAICDIAPAFNSNAGGNPNVAASGPAIFWNPRLWIGATPQPPLGTPSQYMMAFP